MKIGQLAAAAGVSVQTIRYYERRRLLPPASRLRSGYRDYNAGAVDAVVTIKQLQAVGFTLCEVHAFLSILTREPHDPADTRALVEAKLRQMDEQINRLQCLRLDLRKRLDTCKCCNPRTAAIARDSNRRKGVHSRERTYA